MSTIKFVGDEREWEGRLIQWDKHKECIIHWCDGGSVDVSNSIIDWAEAKNPEFFTNHEYRKKQREAKVGEVWGNCNHVWVRTIDGSENFDGWFRIDGQLVDTDASTEDLDFLASDLEEYYRGL